MSDLHPTIQPRPGILEIAPYVGGQSSLPGANRIIKLSSNENPYGPSPKAKAAFAQVGEKLEFYPATGHEELRSALATIHGLKAENITCGNGSDELISLLCQAYAGEGDNVVHTEHGFSMYRLCALANGARPVSVKERDLHTDVDATLAACDENTKLVFIANPNNPTGTLIGADEVARLAEGLPAQALLVLDGAYAEYVKAGDYDAGRALVERRDNVVMTRTFSKIYGLAALRVGWCYAPDHVSDVLGRMRGPFNVNAAALAAAVEAVRDTGYTEDCVVRNEVWRDWLVKKLEAVGVPCVPSHGNFILAKFGADYVEAADAFYKSRGIILRKVGSYNLPDYIRITVGDEEGCRLVAETAKLFMEQRS